jgi:dihydropteroate synthase
VSERTGQAERPARTLLLAAVITADAAAIALAEGADLIDVTGCAPGEAAAIASRYPAAVQGGRRPLAGPPGPGAVVDADLLAAQAAPGEGDAGEAGAAAVIAVAAISSWLGASVVRSAHVRPARRAIDMAASIAGTRPPALTTRGLA